MHKINKPKIIISVLTPKYHNAAIMTAIIIDVFTASFLLLIFLLSSCLIRLYFFVFKKIKITPNNSCEAGKNF